jgi:hypothetical protein
LSAAKLNNSPTIEITEAAFHHIATVNLRGDHDV